MHGRHAVFRMPGFKIRMPVEPLALEAGLVVDPGLVHIVAATENLLHPLGQSRIAGQVLKGPVQEMHGKHGPDLMAIRLGDSERLAPVVLTIEQLAHGLGQRGHLLRRQKTGLEKKAVFLETIQLLFGQWAGQVAAFDRILPTLVPVLFRLLVQPGGVGVGLYRGRASQVLR